MVFLGQNVWRGVSKGVEVAHPQCVKWIKIKLERFYGHPLPYAHVSQGLAMYTRILTIAIGTEK
jgi:hypothetical protein